MGTHYERARLLHRQGRYEQAARELRDELAEDPHDGQTHAFLGRCLVRLKQMPEGLEEGEEGVRLAPHLPFTHFMLGLTYLDLNRLDKAEAALGEALRLDPRNPEQLDWMSWVQYQRGDKRGALETAERGLAIDPQHVGCLNRRGYYLRWLGNWRGSEESLRAALRLDPDNAYTHTSLAWTLWNKAHARSGGTALRLWTVPWRPLGESLRHLLEALRLDPTSDWARSGVAEVLLARARSILVPVLVAILFAAVWLVSAAAGASHGANGIATPLQPMLTGRLLVMLGLITLLVSGGPACACMVVRWTRLGRAVLSPAQRRTALATTACLGVVGAAALACLVTPPPSAFAVVFLGLVLIGPIAAVCEAASVRARIVLIGYGALLAALGLLGLTVIVRFQLEARPDEAALTIMYLTALGSWFCRGITRKLQTVPPKKPGSA